MIDREYARLMARYNRWMNTKVYDGAARLSEAQRKEDRGAFFKSLHGTLNHIVLADRVWLDRFLGRTVDQVDWKAGLDEPFASLRARREALDVELLDWVETLTPEWLAADFGYCSRAYNRRFARPAWSLVAHLFNHQTHHRGQATTLLMQFGIDPGATDLPLEPVLVATYDPASEH